MLIRIWWKEMRSLLPIAATLAVTLIGLQWFLLSYGGADIRRGVLVPISLGWATLYALVAGAASFAGERELKMMGFLDALPVGRGKLWLGKVTFAVGSSLLVGVAFRLIGLLGWDWAAITPTQTFPTVDTFFGLILVEAAVWGLVWSSLSKNAISAGVLAVITTAITVSLGSILGWDAQDQQFGLLDPWAVGVRLGLIGVGLAASFVVLDRELNGWFRPQQRPTVAQPRRMGWLRESRLANWSLLPSPGFWSVAWQSARDGRLGWWLSLAIVTIPTTFVALVVRPSSGSEGLFIVLLYLMLLIQGTSVFGLENAAGTRQFLDNQAVRPRTAWAAKVAVAGLRQVVVFALLGLVLVLDMLSRQAGWGPSGGTRDIRGMVLALATAADTFTVGMMGGMIFTRRITAVMVSFLALLLIVVPQVSLYTQDMIPAWSLGLTPLILVGISYSWAGDWLAARGDLRRWGRLAVLGIAPTVGLCLWYIAGRAWDIPDIGPQYLANSGPVFGQSSPRNAYVQFGTDWRRPDLGPESNPVDLVVAADLVRHGWSSASPEVLATWKANSALIDEARRLAAEREAVFCGDPSASSFESLLFAGGDTRLFVGIKVCATLLAWDGLERRSRGDFAGAWEDILAQYRISVQAAAGARSLADYYAAMRVAEGALQQALAWTREPNVPLDAVRVARVTVQDLPLPDMTNVILAESRRLEVALDVPTERWVDEVTPSSRARAAVEGSETGVAFQRIINSWAIVPAWERERTRRILRSVTRIALDYARNDHFERDGYLPFYPQDGRAPYFPVSPDPTLPKVSGVANRDVAYAVTPLADRVTGGVVNSEREYDRELTNRRALDTILAIRLWQITHGGEAPVDLTQLIPVMMDQVPVDPFSLNFQPLGYLRAAPEQGNFSEEQGDAWLFSVGPDGRRTALQSFRSNSNPYTIEQRGDDLIYELPAHNPPPKPTP